MKKKCFSLKNSVNRISFIFVSLCHVYKASCKNITGSIGRYVNFFQLKCHLKETLFI